MERYLRARSSTGRGRRRRAEGRRHARRALPGRLRRRHAEPRHDRAARPARRGRALAGAQGHARSSSATRSTAAFVFKTVADPFAGRINFFRVFAARSPATRRSPTRATHQGAARRCCCTRARRRKSDALGAGDIGAVAKLKDVVTGDMLVDHGGRSSRRIGFPAPVMSFAVKAKAKGDEDKVPPALRRLGEEDPTLHVQRDPQTGEKILSGMSQVHVEVTVDRLQRRFNVDVELQPPRVPYSETIRKEARAQGRYKKQTGGRGQFGDSGMVVAPLRGRRVASSSSTRSSAASSRELHPGRRQGRAEAMGTASSPAPRSGVHVTLFDGKYHPVDSSDMAFKIAGSIASRRRTRRRSPCCSSRSWTSRSRSPTSGGRHHRRHQLAARPRAGDGAARRDDGDRGRGAARRDPELRAGADVHDGRPRRLPRWSSCATRKCRRTSRRRSSSRRRRSGKRRRRRARASSTKLLSLLACCAAAARRRASAGARRRGSRAPARGRAGRTPGAR